MVNIEVIKDKKGKTAPLVNSAWSSFPAYVPILIAMLLNKDAGCEVSNGIDLNFMH
jgi:hypothetical protein